MGNRVFVETSPQTTASAPAQTSIGTTAAVFLSADQKRKCFMVQNTGTTVIKLGFGATPTQTVYHVALSVCAGADDGSGGVYIDDSWTGIVNGISSGASGTCVVTEFKTGSPDWDQASDLGLT